MRSRFLAISKLHHHSLLLRQNWIARSRHVSRISILLLECSGLNVYSSKSHMEVRVHEFDTKIRVLTATMTRNQINVYRHWTQYDFTNSIFWYEHFLMYSWTLSERKEEFYSARKGLEALCNRIAEERERDQAHTLLPIHNFRDFIFRRPTGAYLAI
ncbi:hypothetical protein BJX76DRAFT_343669 [Aspergillus varians]